MSEASREGNEAGDFKVARLAFMEEVSKCIEEMSPYGWKPGISSSVRYWNTLPYGAILWELKSVDGKVVESFAIFFNDEGRFVGGCIAVIDRIHGQIWPLGGGLIEGWPHFSLRFKLIPQVQKMVWDYAEFYSMAAKRRVLGFEPKKEGP